MSQLKKKNKTTPPKKTQTQLNPTQPNQQRVLFNNPAKKFTQLRKIPTVCNPLKTVSSIRSPGKLSFLLFRRDWPDIITYLFCFVLFSGNTTQSVTTSCFVILEWQNTGGIKKPLWFLYFLLRTDKHVTSITSIQIDACISCYTKCKKQPDSILFLLGK